MFAIKGNCMNDIYREACHSLTQNAENAIVSRGEKIYEISNAIIELSDPRNNLVTLAARGLSKRYAAGELAFYLAGSDSLEFIAHYSKFWRGISDDGETVNSCYGKRLFAEKSAPQNLTQLEYVLKQLRAKPDTKKAVAIIYKERDTNSETKDNPCTMYLHFSIRDNALNATAVMRSNDVWFGLPYDVFFFTTLQQIVRAKLLDTYPDLRLGTYTHIANSLHLYHRDYQKAYLCSVRGVYDKGTTPEIRPADVAAIPSFLGLEQSLRQFPGGPLFYSPEMNQSKFFSLMLSYLEAKNA